MKFYDDFNIVNSTAGGLLLGISASTFLALTGNISGLSFITQSTYIKHISVIL